jgi:CheY-like chemotaxis protein
LKKGPRSVPAMVGLVCGQANDGLQAVEQAKLLRRDLIIMDLSRPDMNGIDATRIIRAEVSESAFSS